MKIVCYFVLLLGLMACAGPKQKTIMVDAPEETGLPEWIIHPEKGCSELRELCASAEASNLTAADINAKKALASIFETKISSDFQMRLQNIEGHKASFKVQEEVRENIEESVEEVLKGAQIKERFKHNDIYFSLAKLDKKETATIFEREIHKLDEKILYNLKQKRKSMYQSLLADAEEREILYQKYIIVSDRELRAPYTSQDIENLRYASHAKKRIIVKTSSDFSPELKKYIENTFTQSGYEVTDANNYFYLVKLKWRETLEEMKVKGFIKVTFVLEIDVWDNASKKVGGTIISETKTGRNIKQAFERAKPLIKEKVSESLGKLNMY